LHCILYTLHNVLCILVTGGAALIGKGIRDGIVTGDGKAVTTGVVRGVTSVGTGVGQGVESVVTGAADGVLSVGQGLFSGVKSAGKGIGGAFLGKKRRESGNKPK
jgi:phage-related protein